MQCKWKSQEEFGKKEYEDWMVNDKAAGQMRQVGNLHFLRVFDAGHMVPRDQPENSLDMVNAFITGQL